MKIDKMIIKGYKSIENCEIILNDINVIIGANGAGKSNFISVFKLLQSIYDKKLQNFVGKNGGPDSILHFGEKITEKVFIEIEFAEDRGLSFALYPTSDNRLMIDREWGTLEQVPFRGIDGGYYESKTNLNNTNLQRVYHFHDTSDTAYLKKINAINDNLFLRSDASNLAAFLYRLRESEKGSYEKIVKTIRLVAPFFNEFLLRPNPLSNDKIELEWYEIGSDIPFKGMHFSDGTLRFICLATALLQPESLQPDTILIDEPELGLHPYAITVLASLIKSVSKREKQVIISTQSVELLNEFDVEDIIVADRENNSSVFRRLDKKNLQAWLEDYSIGELWEKNLLGGRPAK